MPPVAPKVLYACIPSLMLHLKQFDGQNDPVVSERELNKLKASLKKRASDLFLKIELSIYGEVLQKEMFAVFTAKRLATAALKLAATAQGILPAVPVLPVGAQNAVDPRIEVNRNDPIGAEVNENATNIVRNSNSSSPLDLSRNANEAPNEVNVLRARQSKSEDDCSDDGEGPALYEGRLTDYFFSEIYTLVYFL